MPKRRKGRSVRKNKSPGDDAGGNDNSGNPHSFVIPRGKVGKFVGELVKDFRKVSFFAPRQ